jgi:Tfp pilus assembly protein FimT
MELAIAIAIIGTIAMIANYIISHKTKEGH